VLKWAGTPGSRRATLLFLFTIILALFALGTIKVIAARGNASGFTCSATGSNATRTVTVIGAKANGSSDDSAAIQGAIDAAYRRGGGIVALPAGTFMINSHLWVKSNVKLMGVGPATVIKAGPGFLSTEGPGGGYPVITAAHASNVTISNLTADQSRNTLNGNVDARLSGYAVEGFDSHNVVIDSVYTRNPFTYSIAIVGSRNFCVENSNVQVGTTKRYDQLDGIHILDSNSGQVINNTVQSGDDGLVAHTISAPVYNVLYAHNMVDGGNTADGLQLAVGNFPIYNIKIEDNNFYGSFYGIRTGYYSSRTGAVRNISIHGNYIHNLAQGRGSPAIEIGGFGGLGPIDHVAITSNRVCDAGAVTVQPGPGNVVRRTIGCEHGVVGNLRPSAAGALG
jgi:polygalacturonase